MKTARGAARWSLSLLTAVSLFVAPGCSDSPDELDVTREPTEAPSSPAPRGPLTRLGPGREAHMLEPGDAGAGTAQQHVNGKLAPAPSAAEQPPSASGSDSDARTALEVAHDSGARDAGESAHGDASDLRLDDASSLHTDAGADECEDGSYADSSYADDEDQAGDSCADAL